jgi:hypothetical protein
MFHRFTTSLVVACCLLGPAPLLAQEERVPHAEDHEQLRAILVELRDAINERDFAALEPHMFSPFSATMIDQTLLTSGDELSEYFESLFAGDDPLIRRLTMDPVADTLTEIYDDKYDIARGGNTEVYEMASGNTYTLESRWTATLVKDENRWKVLAIHSGVDFLDNPIFAAARRGSLYFGGGGLAIGLLGGMLIGWFLRRIRS